MINVVDPLPGTRPADPGSGIRRCRNDFGLGIVCIEVFVVLSHIPSLRQPHIEADEIIFTFMAERVASDPLHYTLRGPLRGQAARRFIRDTWVQTYPPRVSAPEREMLAQKLSALNQAEVLYQPLREPPDYAFDPTTYDRPLFFHPPIYPALLALFRMLFGFTGGPVLSILAHGGTVLLVALLGRNWGGEALGWVAGAIAAIEPVSWMCGSRLWIDATLECLAAAALYTAFLGFRSARRRAMFAAGIVWGLACLTKLPAVLLAPALLLVWWRSATIANPRGLISYAAAMAILLVPWLVLTRVVAGYWIPNLHPTPWMVERYPFIREMLGRPPYYYPTGLVFYAPIMAYGLVGLIRIGQDAWLRIPLVWTTAWIGALTLIGVLGQGFQLRYLAPAMPALCLLAAHGVLARRKWWWMLPAAGLAPLTFASGFLGARQPSAVDPSPVLEKLLFADATARAEVCNNRGVELAQQGRIDEAVECWQDAIAIDPTYANAYINLGNAQSLLGRKAEALQFFREAVRLAPRQPTGHLALAIELEAQNGLQEAIVEYQQTLQLDRENRVAAEGLRRLRSGT